MSSFFRYLAVGLLGAVVGGYAVARATDALPKIMSRCMDQMTSRMDPEQRERCRAMFARMFGSGEHARAARGEEDREAAPSAGSG